MTETTILICTISCIICPIVSVFCIIFMCYSIIHRMYAIEKQFLKLYNESEARINQTNGMICKLSACIEKTENVLMTITNDYEYRMDKLQETHDKVMEQKRQFNKAEWRLDKTKCHSVRCRDRSAYQRNQCNTKLNIAAARV